MKSNNIYVYSEHKSFMNDAQNLAKHLNIGVIDNYDEMTTRLKDSLILRFSKEGLSLDSGHLSLREDYITMLPRVKADMWKHEILAKAAKFKNYDGPLRGIDATAGLGEDALILAAAGFEMTLYEQDPVIAALLKDAIRRGKKHPELKNIVSKMKVIEGNSIELMPKLLDEVELIYLDPMFPERQKSSLIKKKFQVLQKLESPCMEEEELLNSAMKVHTRRIVIKRPAKGPFVANVKPDYSIDGTAIRYDCISPWGQ